MDTSPLPSYVLADNKLAERAGWDLKMRALQAGELAELGVDLAGLDAFESVVSEVLWRDGYWVQSSFKVELTKDEKAAIDRPSSPRWELDIVGYSGRRHEVLVVECKSDLNCNDEHRHWTVAGRDGNAMFETSAMKKGKNASVSNWFPASTWVGRRKPSKSLNSDR